MGKRSWIGPAWRKCWRETRGCERVVGWAILPAAAFQAARRRLKAGCSHDWLPHGSLFFPRCDVAGAPSIVLVPLWGFGAVRYAVNAQRHRAIHLGHVVVVELGPLVAGAVIVREDVTDRKRGGWNTGVGKGGVVAAGEKRIAVLLVLHHADAGSLSGLAQERGDVGVVEARQIELEQARPLGVVGAAQLLQVDIGHGLRQREYGVLAIVTGAQTAQPACSLQWKI